MDIENRLRNELLKIPGVEGIKVEINYRAILFVSPETSFIEKTNIISQVREWRRANNLKKNVTFNVIKNIRAVLT